jgi:hypothetical protein
MRTILLLMCATLLACGSDETSDPDASDETGDANIEDGLDGDAAADPDASTADGGDTPDAAGTPDGLPLPDGALPCGSTFCTEGQECCTGQGAPVCMTAGTCPMP